MNLDIQPPAEPANWGIEYDDNLKKVLEDAENNAADPVDTAQDDIVFAFRAKDLKRMKQSLKYGDTIAVLAMIRSRCVRLPLQVAGISMSEIVDNLNGEG